MEVLADRQAASFQDRQDALARRARVCRRLEHHELACAEALRDVAGGALDVREVGLALLGKRRRHGDEDRVGVAQLVEVGRRAQAVLD
jgi:hypothetical protein